MKYRPYPAYEDSGRVVIMEHNLKPVLGRGLP